MSTRSAEGVAVVHGEDELVARTGHLIAAATDVAFAATTLHTWRAARRAGEATGVVASEPPDGVRLRKIYLPNAALDPAAARDLARFCESHGASIRITTDDINDTMLIDRRIAILGGDPRAGRRTYSVITQPDVVAGVAALFDAVWRNATDLSDFDAQVAEIRDIAPQVLDLLSRGVKDEAAARSLGLGVRTYRRRVAELMSALGAESRFQAGVRARELGLV
ncbi:response regulator transcription factor [Nocardioides sp. J54]|uniref:response regulator transcription factor n=1 Tax=Nocardioides sp. J54 TaxID=935866 RepID=UPI00048FC5F0|nr:response regulator transcription factor [Nocardioides sp. J54]